MNAPTLGLVARSESRIQTYREALELRGFACQPANELKDLPALTCRLLFNGVLLDMPIITKASTAEKTQLEDILKALPSAYLNIAPATDSIKLLMADNHHGMARSLDEFLAICSAFTPRLVRPNDRVSLHLNAQLTGCGHTDQAEQTVTLNVSSQGCFLFSTHPGHQPGQQVQVRFVGLEDQTPISCTIRWVRPWGACHQMPGIGVTFEQINQSQQTQLNELMASFKPY
jgi:hypothetical protein